MIKRHSSRRASLYETFLKPRLAGAQRYDRIAGYFQSSLLELASESLADIPRIRIVCNTEVSAEDVKTVRMATGARRKELEEGLLRLAWNAGHFPHLVDVHGVPAQTRLNVLHDLLMASGKDGRLFEIRLVPDSEFGFVHGKGGIIEGDWGKTSFIGSANDSARAWTKNYELVWEDDDARERGLGAGGIRCPVGQGLSRFLNSSSNRSAACRSAQSSSMSAPGRRNPHPDPLLAEVPTATELFGFWDHQKYFINLAFQEHLKYRERCAARRAFPAVRRRRSGQDPATGRHRQADRHAGQTCRS